MPTHDIVQALESRILLVAPSLGYWRGRYQLDDATVAVGGESVDADAVTSPQAKLLDSSEWLSNQQKKFSVIDTARNKLVSRLSVNGTMRGIRIIPVSAVSTFMAELIGRLGEDGQPVREDNRDEQSIGYRLGSAANDFVANYDRLIEELATYTPARIWQSVRSRIPTRTTMRSFFYLRCPAMRIASPSSQSLHIAGVNMADIDTIFNQGAAQQVDEVVNQIVMEPRAELKKAIMDLRSTINTGKNVTAKSFKPVQAARQKFDLFEFGTLQDQPDLLSKLNQLQARTQDMIPTELNAATSSNNGFDKLLLELIMLLSDRVKTQDVAASFNRRIRTIG